MASMDELVGAHVPEYPHIHVSSLPVFPTSDIAGIRGSGIMGPRPDN